MSETKIETLAKVVADAVIVSAGEILRSRGFDPLHDVDVDVLCQELRRETKAALRDVIAEGGELVSAGLSERWARDLVKAEAIAAARRAVDATLDALECSCGELEPAGGLFVKHAKCERHDPEIAAATGRAMRATMGGAS